MIDETKAKLRAVFTNEVIRAVGALARQRDVCREQGGQVVFVTGMDAAREYLVEHVQEALGAQMDPDVILALASKLEATFDPGANLPDDCEELAERHVDAIGELRGLAECALMEDDGE